MALVSTTRLLVLAHVEEVNALNFSTSSLNEIQLLLLGSGSLAHEHNDLNANYIKLALLDA